MTPAFTSDFLNMAVSWEVAWLEDILRKAGIHVPVLLLQVKSMPDLPRSTLIQVRTRHETDDNRMQPLNVRHGTPELAVTSKADQIDCPLLVSARGSDPAEATTRIRTASHTVTAVAHLRR